MAYLRFYCAALSLISLTSFSLSSHAADQLATSSARLKCLECITMEYGNFQRFDTCHLRQQQLITGNDDDDASTTTSCAACVRENLTITFSDTTSSPVSYIMVTSFHCLPSTKTFAPPSRPLVLQAGSNNKPVIKDDKTRADDRRDSCITPDIHRYVRVKLKTMRLQQQASSSVTKHVQQLNRLWLHTYENLEKMLTKYGEQALAQIATNIKASICRCDSSHWCNDNTSGAHVRQDDEDLNSIKSAKQRIRPTSLEMLPKEVSNSAYVNKHQIIKLMKTVTTNLL